MCLCFCSSALHRADTRPPARLSVILGSEALYPLLPGKGGSAGGSMEVPGDRRYNNLLFIC